MLNKYVHIAISDQEPEEGPSNSQPCGRGGLRKRPPLLRVSPGTDREKRGSAHHGRAQSHAAVHSRVPEGLCATEGSTDVTVHASMLMLQVEHASFREKSEMSTQLVALNDTMAADLCSTLAITLTCE